MDVCGQMPDIAYAIVGLLAGIGGTLVAVRFNRSNRVNGSGNAVDQSNARSQGDITGRDKRGS